MVFGLSKFHNLAGEKFGRLTALRPTEKRQNGGVVWTCRCDCGNTVDISARYLVSGDTKSCGCLGRETQAARAKDLTGRRFGRLTALRPTGKRRGRSIVWACVCDCGEKTEVQSIKLLFGHTKSCGCLLREIIKDRHGDKNPAWQGGISFDPYCSLFNGKFKEWVRDKFDRKCVICNVPENGKKHPVHHIDYNKNAICNGQDWAFVSLCSSCHSKTNHNRWYWFNLLINYWTMNPNINFNLTGLEAACYV